MSLRVLIADDHRPGSEGAEVVESINAGTDGCLSKGATRESVIQAIRGVAEGRALLDPNVTAETTRTNLKSIHKKLGVRYWTDVTPKSILRDSWHRIRKGK